MADTIANILSIAGSDPSGGAGIQADLKTFAARGTYGMAVLTALTAQNTQGVSGVHLVPPSFVAAQIADVFADVRVGAVKIGMIASGEIAEAVANALSPHRSVPIVLDPVMIAKGGASLLAGEAVEALTRRLLPLSTLLTPNLPEAAALLAEAEATDRAAMQNQAKRLLALGPKAVMLKGGHLPGNESPDVLAMPGGLRWFEGLRVLTRNTHGTGCTLSAALAALRPRHHSWEATISEAKAWLQQALLAADSLEVGNGIGPVHHFHQWW